jgi:hemolysin activation/secretion protein
VELKVTDELPVHGSLEVNDRYTADTSRLRVTAGVGFDNLFQRQHTLSLQVQTAPEDPDETRAIVASYTFRVPQLDNTLFAVYAVDSKSDIAALGTLSVLGNGRIYGARMIRTLAAQSTHYSSLSFGLDYKDFLEDIRLEADEGLVTPISYLDWSLDYTSTLRSADGARTTTFNAGLNFGVRGLFNSQREFADKRFQAQANYFYVRGSAEHQHPLPGGFRAFGKLAGQLARSPLVSNEQLVLGGVESVRGYLESSHLGDYGLSGTLELRHGWPFTRLGVPADRGYLFAFFDAGRVFVLEPLEEQTSRFSLGSYGVGLRLTGWHGLDLGLDLARVLRDSGSVARGDQRVHFSVRYAY